MNKNLEEAFATVPNIITVIRLFSAPLILLGFWFTQGWSPRFHFWLTIAVILAAASDFLDGWWARRFNCVTNFGKIHDPLADKWLAVLYLPLVGLGLFPFMPVALLWLRDITSTHLRGRSKKIISARLSGKIKTLISFPLLCLLIAAMPINGSYFAWLLPWRQLIADKGGALLSLVCIWSGIDYYYQIAVKDSKDSE